MVGGADLSVVADVLEDAGEEGGKCSDFAGAEEIEGVGLDEGRPVALVGVEGVEEDFLDSGGEGVSLVGRRGRESSVVSLTFGRGRL